LSLHDALIVASQSSAAHLYSEDMQHGRTFALTIVNPFGKCA